MSFPDGVRSAVDPLEQAAHQLYEAERLANPQRNLPAWYDAPRSLRHDARYRATAAHHRSSVTIKACLEEVTAGNLAVLDGFIWPGCDNKPEPTTYGPEQYAAIVAERRQLYLYKARQIIAAQNKYMDVDAAGEPEAQRIALIERSKQQRTADTTAVKRWKHIREFGYDMPFVEGVQ